MAKVLSPAALQERLAALTQVQATGMINPQAGRGSVLEWLDGLASPRCLCRHTEMLLTCCFPPLGSAESWSLGSSAPACVRAMCALLALVGRVITCIYRCYCIFTASCDTM